MRIPSARCALQDRQERSSYQCSDRYKGSPLQELVRLSLGSSFISQLIVKDLYHKAFCQGRVKLGIFILAKRFKLFCMLRGGYENITARKSGEQGVGHRTGVKQRGHSAIHLAAVNAHRVVAQWRNNDELIFLQAVFLSLDHNGNVTVKHGDHFKLRMTMPLAYNGGEYFALLVFKVEFVRL